MKTEWTVIVEPQDGKGFIARIAELPAVTAMGKTAAAARAAAAARLRKHLDRERAASLRRAPPMAAVDRIRVETTPPKKKLRRPRKQSSGIDKLLLELLAQGRIDHIPSEQEVDELVKHFKPIRVEGRPISEEIIEDRR
jgi:predicted RNase H-like HicB family nuclease